MSRQSLPPPTNSRALDENGVVVRGAEPAPATTVMRHMVYGSGLTHALDYVVLLHTLFRLEENQAFTPKDIWRDLQAEGVRSAKNANELVGRDAVYQSFNRLIEAKFIRRTTVGGAPGRFGQVRYELYRQPAYNPEYAPPQEPWDPQDEPDFPRPADPLPGTPEADKADGKTAGHTASRNTGTGNAVSGVPGSGRGCIPAGRTAPGVPGSGKASPPHPPEGGGTTPPNPPKTGKAAKWEAACALHSEDYVPTTDEVQAANDFLQDLPGRWQCGPDIARDLAPLLASRAHTQGYELDDFFALELTRDDSKNPARMPVRTLPGRIRDLKRRREQDGPPQASGGRSGGLVQWCGECNRGEYPAETFQRTVELPDGRDVPCVKCHPKHVRLG
ncbi:hypothetical protein AB0H07_39140 [Streptomyces sp. NPDC021354]|uniref:hypothetical protein n=1 Tax=Streptomyces sp. NPDC021354 TaxID=3154793 RepID=UPI0033FAE934